MSQKRVSSEAEHLGMFSPGGWGAFAGIIVAALIAVPLSASFAFATHPDTQNLFAGRLEEATRGGYMAFWWVVTLLLAALPFGVGFGIASIHNKRVLTVIGAVAILLIIAVVVLGQLFVF